MNDGEWDGMRRRMQFLDQDHCMTLAVHKKKNDYSGMYKNGPDYNEKIYQTKK